MNTKSGISTPVFDTRKNTAFGVHSMEINRSYTEKVKHPLTLLSLLGLVVIQSVASFFCGFEFYRVFNFTSV